MSAREDVGPNHQANRWREGCACAGLALDLVPGPGR